MFHFFGYLFRNPTELTRDIRRAWKTRKAMNEFRKTSKECMWCGRETGLHVHHIEPVSVSPEKAADPRNMIMLCGKGCHLVVGHNGDYKNRFVENIESLCACSGKRVVQTREYQS